MHTPRPGPSSLCETARPRAEADPPPLIHSNGRNGATDVAAPRLDADVVIDGVLDEDAWFVVVAVAPSSRSRSATKQAATTARSAPNLTLSATIIPDFSQVESDVAQIQFDPRQAVGFPEKRPFFLENSENFDVPGGIIHTRSVRRNGVDNGLRLDALFSFQPNPGTVVFAGCGTSLGRTVVALDPQSPYDGLQRMSDGFFLKVSYLFRL